MKVQRIQSFIAMILAAALFACSSSGKDKNEPNQFDCKTSSGQMKVYYSSSSFAGIPLMNIQVQGKKTLNAKGDTIKSFVEANGRFVRGELEDGREFSLMLKKGETQLEIWSKEQRKRYDVDCKAERVVF